MVQALECGCRAEVEETTRLALGGVTLRNQMPWPRTRSRSGSLSFDEGEVGFVRFHLETRKSFPRERVVHGIVRASAYEIDGTDARLG